MSESRGPETHGFQAEVRQLLRLMIHSLYSNREIFLRELISNASDAADKLRFESLARPELLADEPEFGIVVEVDPGESRISISDNGIGMSRDEVIANLGTIARSGTAEFLAAMSSENADSAKLIGQFGVGFYSSFIVADRVVVETRRADAEPPDGVRWTSDGQGEYTLETIERGERGTRVTLHLKKDAAEFADALRVESLIRKYSDHIAFPVTLAGGEPRVVNSATALWTRSRSEITEDEYREFYKHLSHDFSDPLAWSHNRVEGKREYTSLMYVPANPPFDIWNREAPRGLKLYVQRVFIMDDADQFLPLYLRFIKGIVDSSDLPLNVSRELLQETRETGAMRAALTKRALDMLKKLADGDDYAVFWKGFGNVLKEGIVEDAGNRDRIARLLRFATTSTDGDAQTVSLMDYVARMKDGQDSIYYLLADKHATAAASPQLEKLRARGFEVLLLTDAIDPWVVDHLPEFGGRKLVDVARERLDLPEDPADEAVAGDEDEALLGKVGDVLADRVERVDASRRLTDSPACVVAAVDELSPQVRRLLEASGQQVPLSKPILEVNTKHPLIERLSVETDERRFRELAETVLDHALIAEGASLANPADYVRRMNRLLLDADSGAHGAGQA